jgi:hypothetical protein
MKLGTGNRNQTVLAAVLGILGLIAVVYIGVQVNETFGGGSSTPATSTEAVPVAPQVNAAPVAANTGRPARPIGTTSASLDPTLHMEAMLVSESVVYAGTGRNIFSPNSAPPAVVIQKPIAPARPQPVVQQVQAPVVPVTCPPQCPPIDLKFFGTTETLPNGKLQAFLLHDDNVYLASAGDVVLRRYRVISIESRTIQVEDMQNNNKQTLPLLISNQ